MGRGEPLNDEDRAPWLERIRDAAFSLEQKNEQGVIVCSALKKSYRDQIRDGNQQVTFLFLNGSKAQILERLSARKGHFMKSSMLDSQFAALECPSADETDVIEVSIDGDIPTVVERAIKALQQGRS